MNLELNKVAVRLQDQHVELRATEAALDFLATEGYDPEMGARPLRRVIQSRIEDRLSDAFLEGVFSEGDIILVDVNEDNDVLLKRLDTPENEEKIEPADVTA